MKKITCMAFGLLFFGAAVMAQTGGSQMMDHKAKDCLMMKDGKVIVMKGGMSMQLTKDTTLKNGVMVMMDGNVKKKDGSTYMLKNGESVGGNGKIMMSDKMSDGKM
jgi:hypothetical protein